MFKTGKSTKSVIVNGFVFIGFQNLLKKWGKVVEGGVEWGKVGGGKVG